MTHLSISDNFFSRIIKINCVENLLALSSSLPKNSWFSGNTDFGIIIPASYGPILKLLSIMFLKTKNSCGIISPRSNCAVYFENCFVTLNEGTSHPKLLNGVEGNSRPAGNDWIITIFMLTSLAYDD